jgi:hypothetical protein
MLEDSQLRARIRKTVKPPPHQRIRRVHVVRDYGMLDQREAPRYCPDAIRADAVRAAT